MVSTKYENDDNRIKMMIMFQSFAALLFWSPKHVPMLDHGIFEWAR